MNPNAYGLAGFNQHTWTGAWGTVSYWNAFVANLELQGEVVYDLNGITRPDWDKLPRDYRQTGDARWDGVTPARPTQSPQ